MKIIKDKIKIELGDIFEINTSKGKAYIQYVFEDKSSGEYIRVFYDLHKEKPKTFMKVIKKDFFYLCFALKAAVKLNIVKKVCNIMLSSDFLGC